ncbi:hypothetical protein KKI24_01740 [bacterium]|nr:hypothetical protein [bacterium]
MKFSSLFPSRNLLVTVLFFLGACAPETTFYVRRPAQLPIKNIDNIAIGNFADATGEEIPLPAGLQPSRLKSRGDLQPEITRFTANKKTAEFIKSMVTAGLATSGQYRLVDLGPGNASSGGVLPDPDRTAIVQAKVKYYEFDVEDAEKVFYLLLATKGGLNLRDQAILMATRQGIIAAAERDQKGFQVSTPYIEKVAALEVEFDMIRQSNGEKIVETQRYRAYETRKWGGNPDTSHLPPSLKEIIIVEYQKNESLADTLKTSVADLKLALLDPEVYLARGGKLRSDKSVVKNPLEIQTDLASHVVDRYLRQISQYTEETTLKIASGDPIAVNYLKGNAYEKAINRLENIPRSEEDAFNLALAYESIAENNQAAKYYQEALNKNPGNKTYQEALKRVRE